MLHIVPFYAALLTFLYIGLSLKTIKMRAKYKISIGDSQNMEMVRAIRVHANFAEYAPLALILFSMMEINGASANLIHGLCIVFLIARILHAYGVSRIDEKFIFRMIGIPMTLTSLGVAAIYLLMQFIR